MTQVTAAGTGTQSPINPGNLTSPEILTGWANGVQQLNWDQWCYYMHQHFPAFTCPAPELFGGGMPDNRRLGTARQFLDALRAYFESSTSVPGITDQNTGTVDTVPVPGGGGVGGGGGSNTGGGGGGGGTNNASMFGGLSMNMILGGLALVAIVWVVARKQ